MPKPTWIKTCASCAWFNDDSLRSNGDYAVSKLAKVQGGGGHKNAAGFTTTMKQLHGWLR